MTATGLRFVVLSHIGSPEGDHVDFLIEQQPGKGDLLTFRLPTWPVTSPTEARRLRDHRRLYLTYQGPISQDRGTVIRLTTGDASLSLPGGFLLVTFPDAATLEFHQDRDDLYIARPG